MGLYKQKDTELSDSIKTNYHRIGEFSFNSFTGKTLVTVFSYITFEDAEAGKAPYTQNSYELISVNPLKIIAEAEVGSPIFLIIQQMLEAAILTDIAEFSGATLG